MVNIWRPGSHQPNTQEAMGKQNANMFIYRECDFVIEAGVETLPESFILPW